MATQTIVHKLKDNFTEEEVMNMGKTQREPLRFLIEDESKKQRVNAYRINPEEGLIYSNQLCNKIFENYDGILTLRVLSKTSATQFTEIAYVERTKESYFMESLEVNEVS